ncbi:cytochrome P450 [Cystobacter fuscus]
MLLLIAGLETTVHLLAHSLLFLAERPEEQARLRAQPALLPEPDRFDLHRGQPGLSFGYGVHYCIGAQLARMEARCGLEALLSRFSGFTRTSTELSWGHAITVRGPQHLPLRFIPA